MGDQWPLQHRHVLGQAIRIRSPYVDALSVTQVLALKSLRKKVDKEELSQSQQAGFIYLILCTVSGVAAGLQNTADFRPTDRQKRAGRFRADKRRGPPRSRRAALAWPATAHKTGTQAERQTPNHPT